MAVDSKIPVLRQIRWPLFKNGGEEDPRIKNHELPYAPKQEDLPCGHKVVPILPEGDINGQHRCPICLSAWNEHCYECAARKPLSPEENARCTEENRIWFEKMNNAALLWFWNNGSPRTHVHHCLHFDYEPYQPDLGQISSLEGRGFIKADKTGHRFSITETGIGQAKVLVAEGESA